MSARVEPDGGALAAPITLAIPSGIEAVAPLAIDPDDRYEGPALPNDHPAWTRDVVSLSGRARALVATLRPVLLRVACVWDHRVRSLVVSGRRLEIDASGSYRLE